jgi:DNA-binding transcriptional LysR family regulator
VLASELLRAFVAVADCGGFHRAAERLNLAQSTVSQQIKRLELETRRPLLRRTTRSVTLTDDRRCCAAMRVPCCNLRMLPDSA